MGCMSTRSDVYGMFCDGMYGIGDRVYMGYRLALIGCISLRCGIWNTGI